MITSNICLMVMSISNLKTAALDSTFLHFFFSIWCLGILFLFANRPHLFGGGYTLIKENEYYIALLI